MLTLPVHYNAGRVEIFYATIWIDPEHRSIQFMFKGHCYQLSRDELQIILRAQPSTISFHRLAYPQASPPRRPLSSSILTPNVDIVGPIFRAPFNELSERRPSKLTPLSHTLLEALRCILLPKTGNRDALTALQKCLLAYIV